MKSFSPSSTADRISNVQATTTTHFINTNRLRLVECSGYIQLKPDTDMVINQIYLLLKITTISF